MHTASAMKVPADVAGSEAVATQAKSTSRSTKLPPSQLFDILPIHGVIQPGQKEQVEFSFYAFPWVKANAVATCSVVNGPAYQVGHCSAAESATARCYVLSGQ